MGILLNGNKPSKIIYNGAESSLYFNGSKIWPEGDPYNPLNLPANTVRVRTSDGNVPRKQTGWYNTTYDTATLVSGTSNEYDVYKSGSDFTCFLQGSTNVVEVLGANTSNVTNMTSMFYGCSALTTVALFDTSNVTNMYQMFNSCSNLTSVPLFDTSNVTNMSVMFGNCVKLTSIPLFDTSNVVNMNSICSSCYELTFIPLLNTTNVTSINYAFDYCKKVQSGALALYRQMSSQTNPPTSHNGTFTNCGSDTTTGAAELAQIPSSWK